MASFCYRGRSAAGEAVNGVMDAASDNDVAQHLFSQGIFPVEILAVTERSNSSFLSLLRKRDKVKQDDLIFFSRQMHTLLKAGVPLLDACNSLRESYINTPLERVLVLVSDALNAGSDFSGALRRQPEVFSTLMVSFVELGEATGNLPEVFLTLSAHLEREREMKRRLKAAMRYPMIVIIAISIAIMVINVVVIPAFAKTFTKFKAELPWQTKAMIATSDFTVQYWPFIVMAIGAAIYGWRKYINTAQGRVRWDTFKLRLPIVGAIFSAAAFERFARVMALSIRSGMPWDQSLTLIAQTSGNTFIEKHVMRMRDEVEKGSGLALAAGRSGLFPSLVLQMIAVGEQTGAIEDLMDQIAQYYERDVDYRLSALSGAIEPILTIAIGVIVLILALGVFLPMWNLSKVAFAK